MLELLQTVTQSWQERWLEDILKAFIGGGIPGIIWLVNNRRRAKKQMLAEQEKVRQDLETKHRENTQRMDKQDDKLDELLNERKYIPSHGHRESSGPLTAENIYPKR